MVGLVLDSRYCNHDPGDGHPERPQRISALLEHVEVGEADLAIAPRLATGDEIALCHDSDYVEQVGRTAGVATHRFDADTAASALSYETAQLAVGGALELVDRVMAGECSTGFALVRPPGHHAERERAMGFCLFNSVAVAAAYLRKQYGLARVLIIDWDVHHGNGTQHMFEADPAVLYMSTHQFPFYPGTGDAKECGRGDGSGYTVNVPLPAGCGDAEYLEAFDRIVIPVAAAYEPEFVLISAGFDAHARDPLAGMGLQASTYGLLTRRLLALAAELCEGRCAAILEGGYNLEATTSSVLACLDVMRGNTPVAPATHPSRITPLIDQVAALQREYWRI